MIPWEVLKEPNVWLSVGVYGTNTDGSLAIPTIWANVCVIRAGATAEGDPSADPTPPVWDQLNAEIESLKEAIENGGGGSGGGGGTTGKDGFSPIAKVTQTTSGAVITITDVNGTTTATVYNGHDGADGTAGKDGKTPIKGQDYYTEADKQEIIEEVLEQIPEGGDGNGTVTSVNGVSPDESGNVQVDVGVTVDEVLEAMATVTAIDFSNFENGSFTETVDNAPVNHFVFFDGEGRPSQIDGIVITWG